jgi:hypothetical protein
VLGSEDQQRFRAGVAKRVDGMHIVAGQTRIIRKQSDALTGDATLFEKSVDAKFDAGHGDQWLSLDAARKTGPF